MPSTIPAPSVHLGSSTSATIGGRGPIPFAKRGVSYVANQMIQPEDYSSFLNSELSIVGTARLIDELNRERNERFAELKVFIESLEATGLPTELIDQALSGLDGLEHSLAQQEKSSITPEEYKEEAINYGVQCNQLAATLVKIQGYLASCFKPSTSVAGSKHTLEIVKRQHLWIEILAKAFFIMFCTNRIISCFPVFDWLNKFLANDIEKIQQNSLQSQSVGREGDAKVIEEGVKILVNILFALEVVNHEFFTLRGRKRTQFELAERPAQPAVTSPINSSVQVTPAEILVSPEQVASESAQVTTPAKSGALVRSYSVPIQLLRSTETPATPQQTASQPISVPKPRHPMTRANSVPQLRKTNKKGKSLPRRQGNSNSLGGLTTVVGPAMKAQCEAVEINAEEAIKWAEYVERHLKTSRASSKNIGNADLAKQVSKLRGTVTEILAQLKRQELLINSSEESDSSSDSDSSSSVEVSRDSIDSGLGRITPPWQNRMLLGKVLALEKTLANLRAEVDELKKVCQAVPIDNLISTAQEDIPLPNDAVDVELLAVKSANEIQVLSALNDALTAEKAENNRLREEQLQWETHLAEIEQIWQQKFDEFLKSNSEYLQTELAKLAEKQERAAEQSSARLDIKFQTLQEHQLTALLKAKADAAIAHDLQQGQIDQLEHQLTALLKAKADAAVAHDLQQEQIDQLERELTALRNAKADAGVAYGLQQEKIDQLERELTALRSAKADAAVAHDLQQKQINQLKHQVTALCNAQSDIAAYSLQQEEIDQLKRQVTALRKTKANTAAYDSQQKEVNQLRQRFEALNDQLKLQLTALHNAKVDTTAYGLQQEKIEQLERELTALRNAKSDTPTDAYDLQQKKINQLERELTALRNAQSDAPTYKYNLHRELIDQLQRQLTLLSNTTAGTAAYGSQQKQIDQLRQQVEALDEAKVGREELEEHKASFKAEILSTLHTEMASIKQELSSIWARLNSFSGQPAINQFRLDSSLNEEQINRLISDSLILAQEEFEQSLDPLRRELFDEVHSLIAGYTDQVVKIVEELDQRYNELQQGTEDLRAEGAVALQTIQQDCRQRIKRLGDFGRECIQEMQQEIWTGFSEVETQADSMRVKVEKISTRQSDGFKIQSEQIQTLQEQSGGSKQGEIKHNSKDVRRILKNDLQQAVNSLAGQMISREEYSADKASLIPKLLDVVKNVLRDHFDEFLLSVRERDEKVERLEEAFIEFFAQQQRADAIAKERFNVLSECTEELVIRTQDLEAARQSPQQENIAYFGQNQALYQSLSAQVAQLEVDIQEMGQNQDQALYQSQSLSKQVTQLGNGMQELGQNQQILQGNIANLQVEANLGLRSLRAEYEYGIAALRTLLLNEINNKEQGLGIEIDELESRTQANFGRISEALAEVREKFEHYDKEVLKHLDERVGKLEENPNKQLLVLQRKLKTGLATLTGEIDKLKGGKIGKNEFDDTLELALRPLSVFREQLDMMAPSSSEGMTMSVGSERLFPRTPVPNWRRQRVSVALA